VDDGFVASSGGQARINATVRHWEIGFAALVDYAEVSSFLDVDRVRLEVPVRVRMSRLRLRK
jgi:hypothetical protein